MFLEHITGSGAPNFVYLPTGDGYVGVCSLGLPHLKVLRAPVHKSLHRHILPFLMDKNLRAQRQPRPCR